MPIRPKRLNLLVTLGPTWEFIDPIRFITNRATGILGYLIAQEGVNRGHRMTCVAGPSALCPLPGARWVSVVGAEEMHKAVKKFFPKSDALVMSAAVSDYRVKKPLSSKLKRKEKAISILLEENPDILGDVARQKGSKVLVGFALETEDLLKNASKKLKGKGLDLIVANRVGEGSNPFGNRKVSVHLLWKDGQRKSFHDISKQQLANILLDAVEELVANPTLRLSSGSC